IASYTRPGHPDFLDLPWHLPLAGWSSSCPRIVQVERGLSRHEVLFVSYPPAIYALKELPSGVAEREYDLLLELEKRHLPAVTPAGEQATLGGQAAGRPVGAETGRQVRERSARLWEEITREETLSPVESYRIHERIRALNALGFSVGEVELVATGERNRLRMR